MFGVDYVSCQNKENAPPDLALSFTMLQCRVYDQVAAPDQYRPLMLLPGTPRTSGRDAWRVGEADLDSAAWGPNDLASPQLLTFSLYLPVFITKMHGICAITVNPEGGDPELLEDDCRVRRLERPKARSMR